MTTNGHPLPTPSEWAVAPLHIDKHESEGKSPVLGFRKSLTKGGRTFHQSVWLTLEQLQAVARDHGS